MPTSIRSSPTAQRILDAALACFSTTGYDQTTLADIRARAGASVGSVYHHFRSKEDIATRLYLDALHDTQEAGTAALLRTRTGRTGVEALVHAYLDWVEAHPDRARFLLWMRHASFMTAGEPEIDSMNVQVRDRTQEWFRDRVAAGELPDVDPAIRRAVIYGPCRVWAGRWLAGDTAVTVTRAKRELAAAAYAGLMALM
jgi:AcrR family transcriptional regulator